MMIKQVDQVHPALTTELTILIGRQEATCQLILIHFVFNK